MKTILLTAFGFIAGLQLASAQTAVLYQEDWGGVNGHGGQKTMPDVGWTALPSNYYYQLYSDNSAVDDVTGASLPGGSWYFGGGGTAMFYTINGAGSGFYGDSAYTSIDPTLYTNLQFSSYTVANYDPNNVAQIWFAVQVGGNWYVSTNHPITPDPRPRSEYFERTDMTYNPMATNWNSLTLGASAVIGGQAGANLSGPITGVGLVTDPNGGYVNVNEFLITSISNTAPTLVAAPLSQNVYAGGGVSFSVAASPAQPYSYYWKQNGNLLSNSSHISGANTATLTILNTSAADDGSYTVIVSNSTGYFDTANTGAANLTVNPVPADYLYAETFPFVGPSTSVSYSPGTVGWAASVQDVPNRLYFDSTDNEGYLSAAESYQQTFPTNLFFYTTTSLDTGVSGLAFPTINPAAYPAVTFSVDVDPTSNEYNGQGNSTSYFAVQMNGGNWYVNAIPIPVNTSPANVYATYKQQFNPAATVWNNLTFNSTGATIGSQASADLTGNITGAGVVVAESYESEWDFQNFLIITDSVPATAPSIDHAPISQTVYSGGGVSFQVHVQIGATLPLYYYWQSNGVTVAKSTSLANLAVFSITNATASDAANYSCIASNVAGTDNSANYSTASLTVTSPPPGLLYAETFPTPEVLYGFQPFSSVGWLDNGNGTYLFGPYAGGGQTGTADFYAGGNGNSEYYATTASDTGFSGLPFPSISLAANPNLTLSATFYVDHADTTGNFIVQMNGTSWYISATGLPLVTTGNTTYTQVFAPAAANWNTYNVNTMTVGAPAGADLSGSLTGAGLYFNYPSGVNAGINGFSITSLTSYGSITAAPLSGNSLTLNWTANANAGLQWTTNLTPPVVWTDVPNTAGQGSATITTTNTQMFFRLAQP